MVKAKILQLINSYSWSGSELFASKLAAGLQDFGYESILCSMTDPRNERENLLFEKMASKGVKTLSVGKSPDKKSVGAIYKIYESLQRNDIDLINTHCSSPDFYGRAASIAAPNVKSVVTFHSTNYKNYALNNLLSFTTDKYVAVSDAVKTWAFEEFNFGPQEIETIYNGIDFSRFNDLKVNSEKMKSELGLDLRTPIATSVGSLEPAKGHKYLIDAAEVLKEKGVELNVLIAGQGTLFEGYKRVIEKKKLGDRVHLLGARTNIEEILAISDLFIMPSLWEGFGIAALEAMAAGLPVIASEVGGLNEIIDDNQDGFLVPPEDPEALADSVQVLLNKPAQAKRISKKARSKVRNNFTLANSLRGYDNLYQRLLN